MNEWLWSYAVTTILLWAGILTLIGLGAWINDKRKVRRELDATEEPLA